MIEKKKSRWANGKVLWKDTKNQVGYLNVPRMSSWENEVFESCCLLPISVGINNHSSITGNIQLQPLDKYKKKQE